MSHYNSNEVFGDIFYLHKISIMQLGRISLMYFKRVFTTINDVNNLRILKL